MIELRWLDRTVEHYFDGLPDGTAIKERVLQYRQKEECLSGMTGKPFNRWSDWQDVPTAREE